MKNRIVLVVFFGFMFLNVMAQDGKTLLRQAFDASKTVCYSAKYFNSSNELFMFSQFYDPEIGMMRKGNFAETYKDRQTHYFFRLNDKFFSAYGTIVHPLYFSMMLNTPDDFIREIYPADWNEAQFAIEEFKFKGNYAYKITMTLDDESLSKQFNPDGMLNRQEKRYPAVRVFIVLEKNLLIVSRKHYNKAKELVYSLEFQEVDIAKPLSAEDFVLPGDPDDNQLLDENAAFGFDWAAEDEVKEQAQAAKVAQTKRDNFFKKLFRGGITPLFWCILGISVLCVVFGLCWKRFAKR